MHELDEKLHRLERVCHNAGVGAVILTTQPNFAWITGGRSNRIDGSREVGAGAILVTAGGRRFVLANTIEMPRLLGEALVGVPCEPIEYPWVDDHASPDTLAALATRVTGRSEIGADWPLGAAMPMEKAILQARALLTPAEVDRYRALGHDLGLAIGALGRTIEPAVAEHEVARRAADAAASVGARALVTLVAADERIARFRHPSPTSARWRDLLMVVMCAEREGLVVALSRVISAGPAGESVLSRTRATATVFERLLAGTQAGARGRDLFAAAARAYAEVGFAGEEMRHHQGGAIGYRSRDWIVHPTCDDEVMTRQAFAWNPSITGTKIEETALLADGRLELVTATPGWPAIPIRVGRHELSAPAVLERN
jgi:Xaa-Pro aminopeptidase